MAILTQKEAADLLDYENPKDIPSKVMAHLVPAAEEMLRVATGREWGEDEEVDPLAKMIAGMLIVRWFEDPGQVNKMHDSSLIMLLGQLQGKAREVDNEKT